VKKDIFYATGNHGKFEEVKSFIESSEPTITLKQFDAEIPEIQTMDQKTIAIDKALKAWEILQKPLLVDDSAIYFEKYNNFPGTMTKFVSEGIGFEGICKLIEEKDPAHFLLRMIYIDGPESFHIFEGRCDGTLTKPKEFYGNLKLPYDCFFIPNGTDKSYAQMRGTEEGNKYFYRIKALKSFLEWWHKG
jgi:XTP/dITP diphosphohydrolase